MNILFLPKKVYYVSVCACVYVYLFILCCPFCGEWCKFMFSKMQCILEEQTIACNNLKSEAVCCSKSLMSMHQQLLNSVSN